MHPFANVAPAEEAEGKKSPKIYPSRDRTCFELSHFNNSPSKLLINHQVTS